MYWSCPPDHDRKDGEGKGSHKEGAHRITSPRIPRSKVGPPRTGITAVTDVVSPQPSIAFGRLRSVG